MVLALLASTLSASTLVGGACAADPPLQSGPTSALVSVGAELRGPRSVRAAVRTGGPTHLATLALDASGRLWLAAAAATPHDPGDGVYAAVQPGARPVRVIDVETPLGLLWSGETLFVSSKAGVDAYTGFDGRRFSGHRVVVAPPDGTGESNGLTLASDGRIQMGISAPCDHCGTTLPYSAAIVSFRADGTDLRVDARGIRAPIGLSYYPGTSDLFVTMNQRDDLGAKTPGDWLAVVRPDEDWRFPNCYGQGTGPCAGVPGPVATLDQHAAVSGVTIITGQLSPSIGDAAIVAEWAKGAVKQVTLVKAGGRYTGTVTPFITGIKNPEPMLLTPSGTLLIGDWATGTVYEVSRR